MVPTNVLIFILTTIISCVTSQNSSDLDATIKKVLNAKPTEPTPAGLDTGTRSNTGIPDTESCTCVPYYLCKNGGSMTSDEKIIDIIVQDSSCLNYLDVCCKKAYQITEPTTEGPSDSPSATRKGCGYGMPEGIGFHIPIEDDNEARYGEFPWMVAVLHEETIDGKPLNLYQCGGSLIHPQVVLTAAHCVKDKKKQLKIRAGEWDTQTDKEIYPHQEREVESIVVHPQFNGSAAYNDVALLFLKTPVEIAENVNVACLPPQNVVAENVRCFATGWGKDVFGKEGKYQVILQKIDLPMVPHQQCQDALRTTRLGKYFELHPSFVCAGGEPGKDTCKGDGGSPLVCPIKGSENRFVQAGIVAWSIGCGEKGIPTVFANVAMSRRWIDEQLQAKNIDITTYQY